MTELETIKAIHKWALDLFMEAQEMRDGLGKERKQEWNKVCNLLFEVRAKLDDIKYEIAPTELDKFIRTH